MSQKGKQTGSSGLRFFFSRGFVFLGGIFVLIAGIGYLNAVLRTNTVEQEIAQLEREREIRRAKRLESLELLEYVRSDRYVEEKARTELNLRLPGEQVIVLHGEASATHKGPDGRVRDTRHSVSNPLKWWYYFTQRDAILDV